MWKKPLLIVWLSVNTLTFGRELLPPFPAPLTIAPALPENYVMSRNTDLYSGVTWSERESIDEIDDESVFFFVQLSGDVVQRNPSDFADEYELPARFELMGYRELNIRKTFWQKHPVLTAEYIDFQGRPGYRAWIGLNSSIGGWVIAVSFHYPEAKKAPSPSELVIWKNFLQSDAF